MKIIGRVGLDWANMRRYSRTGGCTSFSPRMPATNSFTALYTRSEEVSEEAVKEIIKMKREKWKK
jgi:hypothetical protein